MLRPCTDLYIYAFPALKQVCITLALVLVALRILAMRALELDTETLSVVDVLGANECLRGIAVLNPIDNGHQDVLLRFVGSDLVDRLADNVGTISTTAVTSTADSEEAVELIKLIGRQTHGLADVVVVPGRVGARDDGIHSTVPVQDLRVSLCVAEVTLPGLDAARINACSVIVVGCVQGCRAPGSVIVNSVPEPISRVGEGVSAQENTRGNDLRTRLQTRVDEVAPVVIDG